MRYDSNRLHEEVAFLSYHFNWSYGTVMNMEHRERQRWCREVSRINEQVNTQADQPRQKSLVP